MIDEITPTQWKVLDQIREDWTTKGLATHQTTAADRADARIGVDMAYRAADLEPPTHVVWVGSPKAGAIASVLLPHWWPVMEPHFGELPGTVIPWYLGGYDEDAVFRCLWEQLCYGDCIQPPPITDRGNGRWLNRLGGNLWASWHAWVEAMEHLGVTGLEIAHGRRKIAHHAGWWWPMRDICVMSERPVEIHGEQVAPDGWRSHQLHCEDGPALSYIDGWGFHVWHGVQVPEWVIAEPTIERINNETNTEIRRCALESFGWGRYLDEVGSTLVHECDDPGNPDQRLQLYEIPRDAQVYEQPTRLLVMNNASLDRDGTRRRFAETVPATISDAMEAAAWQFETDKETYARLARAT